MSINELHTRILGAKKFLNQELVKLKTQTGETNMGFREINDRLDMIHEVERIGYRNLSEHENRKIQRMLKMLEGIKVSNN